ncbi:MAG TPA: APC family permease [Candidatus Angelobacter sp.]|nr:APC family permease [Candidatus Angelobacter sp.]
MSLREFLFGRPLRSDEEQEEQIGPLSGVPVLGLDSLASASYGPEAALTVLLPLGALSNHYIEPITAGILGVLLAVFFSYRQTIPAYPQGGGSFTVAKENLGRFTGLLAGCALCIDYILNVAVAISAAVGALVSVVPSFLPFTLWICLGILFGLMAINLRGLRTAGLVFMLPTYLFVLCLSAAVVIGIAKIILSGGHPVPIAPPPKIPATLHTVGLWLLLRSFASGCTALTGVEAVSNAVPVFRRPKVALAKRTLAIIVVILAFLLIGVALVSRSYGITATPPGKAGYQSVLSIIVGAVAGRGPFYFISMAAILMVLALSANTSFAGFPRVCRVMALDEFLPPEFAHRGRRLVYSAGIIVLTIFAGTLLIVFRGITDRLIPLFAVGAFSAFTLSQLGMVGHWRRSQEPHARRSLILNGAGAAVTASALIIIIIAKFTEGAWIVLVIIPPLLWLFTGIRRYHERLRRETGKNNPLAIPELRPPVVAIPIKRLDQPSQKALQLGLSLSDEVRVVQILAEEMETENLTPRWHDLIEEPIQHIDHRVPKLVVLPSAYRNFFRPFLEYVRKLGEEFPGRQIAVIIPELVERRWYHFLLHRRATLLKGLLLMKGGPEIVIITQPWYRKA